MYYVSAQGVDERAINVHYYYYYYLREGVYLVEQDPLVNTFHAVRQWHCPATRSLGIVQLLYDSAAKGAVIKFHRHSQNPMP